MKKRILSAIVLLPAFTVILLVLPKIVATILFAAMAVMAAYELMYKTGLVQHIRLLVYGMAMAFYVGIWSGLWGTYPMAMLGVFVFACLAFGELIISRGQTSFTEIAVAFVGGVLIPYLITAPVRLLSWSLGRYLVVIPFVIAFLTDSGAYFAGLAFGKHKLAPNISPKKTVEGLFGGIFVAVAGVALYCFILRSVFHLNVDYINGLAYGVLGSLGAVFGDLCFSAIKRQVGIKDYSNLIPGHGGILDRFDSVVVVAILVEVLTLLIPLVVK